MSRKEWPQDVQATNTQHQKMSNHSVSLTKNRKPKDQPNGPSTNIPGLPLHGNFFLPNLSPNGKKTVDHLTVAIVAPVRTRATRATLLWLVLPVAFFYLYFVTIHCSLFLPESKTNNLVVQALSSRKLTHTHMHTIFSFLINVIRPLSGPAWDQGEDCARVRSRLEPACNEFLPAFVFECCTVSSSSWFCEYRHPSEFLHAGKESVVCLFCGCCWCLDPGRVSSHSTSRKHARKSIKSECAYKGPSRSSFLASSLPMHSMYRLWALFGVTNWFYCCNRKSITGRGAIVMIFIFFFARRGKREIERRGQ